MTSLTGYRLAACQYDDYPLIMHARHELFRINFLARCVELNKTMDLTSPIRGDGFSSTVTYVHDEKYDGNELNRLVLADLKLLTESKAGGKVSVFHMRPSDRIETIERVLAMKYEPEPLKMFYQLPDLVNLLLCNKPVADVRRHVSFWDTAVTHRIKCAQAGVTFDFPARRSQGECLPRVLLDQRRPVAPVLEALPLAIYLFVYSQLARHQLSPYAIDGLVHTAVHGLIHGGQKVATYRCDEATLHIDTINDILNMQIVLRASLDGSLPRNQLDPLLLAVIKRASRIYDILNPKQDKYFNAYRLTETKEAKRRNEELLTCVTESKRLWSTRFSTPVDVEDACVQLRRHYAFQQAIDLEQFVEAAGEAKTAVIQITDCAAYSITGALLRYIPRSEFFVAEYRSSRSCQATTILALHPDVLWVYKRATIVRFLTERKLSSNGSKTTVRFDHLPLAPMLLGMVLCENPKPLASRVVVDTLRDWMQLKRLPVFNASTSSAQQTQIGTRCDLAVQGLLALGKARRLTVMQSTAIMLLVLAVLEDDGVRIAERPTARGPLCDLFESLLGRPDAAGKPVYSMSGTALWEKLVRGLIRSASSLDDSKSESQRPYLALFRLVHVGDISLGSVMGLQVKLASKIPDLSVHSSSVYTMPSLQRQFTDSVKIEGRSECKHPPAHVHYLFVLCGLVEQQHYQDLLPLDERNSKEDKRVLPSFTDERQFNMKADEFVARMIVREPPVALVRTGKNERITILYPDDYLCAWPIDRDTDGGLCNENLDLSDRALFFNWLWSPLFMSSKGAVRTWVHDGVEQFMRRAAHAVPSTDYDSDDECVKSTACSRLLPFAAEPSRVVPMTRPQIPDEEEEDDEADVFSKIFDGTNSDDERKLASIKESSKKRARRDKEEEEPGSSSKKRSRSRSPSPSGRPVKSARTDS